MSIGREENYTGAAFGHDLRGWLTFMHFQRFMVKAQISKQKANIAEKRNPWIHASKGYVQAKSYRFILLYKYTKFLPE
jgi:hypothetical protein